MGSDDDLQEGRHAEAGWWVKPDERKEEAMLPTWMIEELEKQRRERDERPRLHIEAPAYQSPQPPPPDAEERGGTVVVIEIL